MYEEDFSEGEMNPDSFYVQLSGFASQAKEPTFLLSYPLLGCAIGIDFFTIHHPKAYVSPLLMHCLHSEGHLYKYSVRLSMLKTNALTAA